MGWVLMSARKLQRIEVVAQIDDGRLSIDAGAGILCMSRRQVFRLLKRYRANGAASLAHLSRGGPANNLIPGARRDFALAQIRERYSDFGPTLAAEKLADAHSIRVSRETLRKWMIAGDLWLPRRHRHRIHQPRLRREYLGELVRIDGSEHRWFEDSAMQT